MLRKAKLKKNCTNWKNNFKVCFLLFLAENVAKKSKIFCKKYQKAFVYKLEKQFQGFLFAIPCGKCCKKMKDSTQGIAKSIRIQIGEVISRFTFCYSLRKVLQKK